MNDYLPSGQNYFVKVDINGFPINPKNIMALIVREWVFALLPRIELQFVDAGEFSEILSLSDGREINVTISRSDNDTYGFTSTFELIDYECNTISNQKNLLFYVTGLLKNKQMFAIHNRSFSNKNSSDVISSVVNESGLKFVNRDKITPSDHMTWYQSSINNHDFIHHVKKRINLPNDAGLVYGNVDGEIVFSTINSRLNSESVGTVRYDMYKGEKDLTDENTKDKTAIYNTSNIIKNQFGSLNRRIGYGFNCVYYDGSKIVETNFTDYGKKLTDRYYKDDAYKGKPVTNRTYSVRNNVYNDYYVAMNRNDALIANFFAYSYVVNANTMVKVKMMDKVSLQVNSYLSPDINPINSGEYLVSGIIHQVSKGGTYLRQFVLNRSGLNNDEVIKTSGGYGKTN